jgi:signal transduction histidine kinase
MQERVESHGGSIRFEASPEGGLEVSVLLPLRTRETDNSENSEE